jgi:hypothetical protein
MLHEPQADMVGEFVAQEAVTEVDCARKEVAQDRQSYFVSYQNPDPVRASRAAYNSLDDLIDYQLPHPELPNRDYRSH